MCFIKNQTAFEKYLEFLVGRVQAESVVVSTAVQEFYKVPLSPSQHWLPSPRSSPLTLPNPHSLPRPLGPGLVRKAGRGPEALLTLQ